MSFLPLSAEDGEPISFLIGEAQTFPGCLPFEPSVFGGGAGQEQRKSIRIDLEEDKLQTIKAFEDRIREKVPWKDKWYSCIADPKDRYSGSLKAKIFVSGEKACIVRNEENKLVSLPSQPWPRPACIARVGVKGVYRQSSSAGLVLHISHLHLAKNQQSQNEPDPFI